LTNADTMRRSSGSLRFSRQVPTTSLPASIASSRRGISSGGFCRSPSSVTTTLPWQAANPASTAACCPALRFSSMTPMRASPSAIARSNASESSLLPSSTYQTSAGRPSPSSTRCRRACSAGMFGASL
jgi:hypothetical protein